MKTKTMMIGAVLALTACTDYEADFEGVNNRISNVEQRVTTLETSIANINNDITALRTLTDALKGHNYIVSVEDTADGYRITFGDAEIIKVNAVHGTKVPCCDAAGFIFRSPNEKTLYVCGDTVWCDDVAETIKKYHPDVIITNNAAAMLVKNGRLIMDDNDLEKVCAAAPEAVVIASHMDNVPHATLTRKSLAKKLKKKGLRERVRIPEDGEIYDL